MLKKAAFVSATMGSVLAIGLIGAPSTFAASTASTSSEPTVQGVAQGSVEEISAQQVTSFSGNKFDVSNVPLVLTNPHYFLIHGQPSQRGNQMGYAFRYLVKVKNGQAGIIELGYDPQTHTQLVEVGTPTAASVAKMQAQMNTGGKSTSSRKQAVRTPLLPGATATATFDTIWEDPVNIHVNEVKDTVNYGYNGSTVWYISGSDYRWWLSNDGWYEVSGQHDLGSYSDGSEASVYTYDEFENDIFCAGSPTYTWYEPNAVIGYRDGSASGYVNTWSDGSTCSSWLHYYSLLNGVIQ